MRATEKGGFVTAIAPIDLHDPQAFQLGIPHEAFAEMRRTPGLTWSPESDGTARASMIDMDPPIHTRLRRIISSAFTPRHVQDYKAAIQQRVAACLDALEAGGGGNWVDIVAKPIPIGVICDLMGVPEKDHEYLVGLTETTRSSMAHLALYLEQFPEAFDEVRADRSLLNAVTDEVIRYSSAILYFRRTVMAPTELSGTTQSWTETFRSPPLANPSLSSPTSSTASSTSR